MIESGDLGVENYGRVRGHVEDSEEEEEEDEKNKMKVIEGVEKKQRRSIRIRLHQRKKLRARHTTLPSDPVRHLTSFFIVRTSGVQSIA